MEENIWKRLNNLSELEEQAFKDKNKRNSHYLKHPIKGMNSETIYEKEADKLALTPIDNINIFGYISNKNNSICKWDKKNRLFVVYYMKDNKPIIKSFYRKGKSEYEKDRDKQAIKIL